MASIDKIYGDKYQHEELYDFLKANNPKLLRYVCPLEEYANYNFDEIRMISNFPHNADEWLYYNCPLTFVQERLHEQYQGVFDG